MTGQSKGYAFPNAFCREILAYIDIGLIVVRLCVGNNKRATTSKNSDTDNMAQDVPVVVEPDSTNQAGDRHQDTKGYGAKTDESCIHHTAQRLCRIKEYRRTSCKVTRGANIRAEHRCKRHQTGDKIRERSFKYPFLRRCQLELTDMVPRFANPLGKGREWCRRRMIATCSVIGAIVREWLVLPWRLGVDVACMPGFPSRPLHGMAS